MQKGACGRRGAYRSRERVARVLAHREADRVPFFAAAEPEVQRLVESMGFGPEQRELALEGDFKIVTFASREDRAAFAPYLKGLPPGASVPDWGIGTESLFTKDGYYAGHKSHHPLAEVDTVAGLESYPFPDFR